MKQVLLTECLDSKADEIGMHIPSNLWSLSRNMWRYLFYEEYGIQKMSKCWVFFIVLPSQLSY